MLRTLRRSDAQAIAGLLVNNFPEEQRLMGMRPEPIVAVVRKLFRPDVRILLGLMRLVGRPLGTMYVVEQEGQLAGCALLSFGANSGYISTVVVAPPFRRHGHARRLLDACREGARRTGRAWVVLDVLAHNAPALRLYASDGYEKLRSQGLWSAQVAPARSAPPVPGLRAMEGRDRATLAELGNQQLPESVRPILPYRASEFGVSPMVQMGLMARSEAWVIDRGRGAEAFVRATVGAATEAGHLTQPIVAASLPEELAAGLVRHAVGWIASAGADRVICEVPHDNAPGLRALTSAGFQEEYALETLVRTTQPGAS